MKQKTIGVITPYFFEDKLIISLSKEWVELFQEIPKFNIIIDNRNRLVLQGPTIQTHKKSSNKNSLSEHKILEIL